MRKEVEREQYAELNQDKCQRAAGVYNLRPN